MKTKINREFKQMLMPAKLVIIVTGILVVTGLPQIAMQAFGQNHLNLIQSRNSMAVLAEQERRNNVQKADKENMEKNNVGFQVVSEHANRDKNFISPARKDSSDKKD
jgi:hypothetical protein